MCHHSLPAALREVGGKLELGRQLLLGVPPNGCGSDVCATKAHAHIRIAITSLLCCWARDIQRAQQPGVGVVRVNVPVKWAATGASSVRSYTGKLAGRQAACETGTLAWAGARQWRKCQL